MGRLKRERWNILEERHGTDYKVGWEDLKRKMEYIGGEAWDRFKK